MMEKGGTHANRQHFEHEIIYFFSRLFLTFSCYYLILLFGPPRHIYSASSGQCGGVLLTWIPPLFFSFES
jgi:hypothetical protein